MALACIFFFTQKKVDLVLVLALVLMLVLTFVFVTGTIFSFKTQSRFISNSALLLESPRQQKRLFLFLSRTLSCSSYSHDGKPFVSTQHKHAVYEHDDELTNWKHHGGHTVEHHDC